MKKRIYLLLLSVVAIFSACKDNSDDFVEQLFTDAQISSALKQCADSVAMKTCNTLCIVDTTGQEKLGYYYYESKSYRIELPNDMKQIADTLKEYGFQNKVDSLIFIINRAAEQCGNRITQFWKPVINDITFPKPNSILHGGNSAITDFLKANKQSEFVAALVSSILSEQFTALNVDAAWSQLQAKYVEITGSYSPTPLGIITPTAQQMVAGFFKKMALEEAEIRTNKTLQGNPNGLLYKVFSTLK